MYDKPLKVSISKGFMNKTPINSKLAYQSGFTSCEISLFELGCAIDDGLTFSYQFRDGIRSAENFQATDILAIDIDYGMKISQAMENPIVKEYGSLLYTTFNHTLDRHRFRLIFILPRTITSPVELSAATRALSQRLGGDKAATDAARMFHGCKNSNPELLEKSITESFLEELILDGKTIPVSESIAFDGSTASRSEYRPDKNLMVRMRDGQFVEASSLKTTTPIHCPFHDDQNPSAFVSRNKHNSVYLYCPKCQKTWWLTGGDPSIVYFDNFEQVVMRLTEGSLPKKHQASLRTMFENPDMLRPENVHVTSSEHLQIPELKDGITLIKSPKGSGKTTYLTNVLEDVIRKYATLEEYEENTDPEDDESFFSEEKILLIGHRQALIGELCQRLRLNCYLDDKGKDYGEIWDRRNRYGVCLDSLWKIQDRRYDIVVIDEVEQVLAHFFSDTLGEKRYGMFGIFSKLIRSAKKVVALDADLGWITFTTLTDLVKSREVSNDSRKTKKTKKTKNPDKPLPVHVYINQWKQYDRVIHLYPNVSQLIQRIKQDIVSGSRIFVCSNSKKKIKALDAALRKFEDELGQQISRIVITSENSRNVDVQTFIKNITTECLNYQVILSSPSLGTGIDISFDNGRQEIDKVYGIFENQINTHFEIDQQLARVRKPREVHAWISPACFNFETEFEVVKQDYLRRNFLSSIGEGFSPIKLDVEEEFSPFLKLAAMVISHQRASKNFLRHNFIRYRELQGWQVENVPLDEELQKEGRGFLKEGKLIAKEEHINSILNARVLNRLEYESIEGKLDDEDAQISEEEWSSFYRTRLELFYREPISKDLIDRDRGGKYRRAVNLYEDFLCIGDLTYEQYYKLMTKSETGMPNPTHQKLFVDRPSQCILIHGLLTCTPIFKNRVFDTDVVFTKEDLKKFVKASKKMKVFVDTQLQINTQIDLENKPTQHLNRILRLIGLEHSKVKVSSQDGEKVYAYQLDVKGLNSINELVEKRRNGGANGWTFLDQHYGFQYPELEDDDFLDRYLLGKRKKYTFN